MGEVQIKKDRYRWSVNNECSEEIKSNALFVMMSGEEG
jgi:hypothetical protein